jgi:hypothetical protein
MKTILGNHPITSTIGLLGGAITAAQTLIPTWTNPSTNSINWAQVIIGVVIAVLGRVSADATSVKPGS